MITTWISRWTSYIDQNEYLYGAKTMKEISHKYFRVFSASNKNVIWGQVNCFVALLWYVKLLVRRRKQQMTVAFWCVFSDFAILEFLSQSVLCSISTPLCWYCQLKHWIFRTFLLRKNTEHLRFWVSVLFVSLHVGINPVCCAFLSTKFACWGQYLDNFLILFCHYTFNFLYYRVRSVERYFLNTDIFVPINVMTGVQ